MSQTNKAISSARPGKKGFTGGISGNAKGRPPGCFSNIKKQFLAIQERAAGDANQIYEQLKEKMDAGESWAYQIYYKELYSLPKKYKEDTVIIPKVDPKDSSNINARLKVLIEALDKFEDFSYDEIIAGVKALASVKSNEVMETQTEHIRLSREELGQKIENITKIMDYMKKEKVDE